MIRTPRRVRGRIAVASVALFAAVSLLAACAAPTRLVAEWRNPKGEGYRIGSVLAVATIADSTSRRVLEDRLVAALAARGVAAQPSYRLLPEAGPASEPQLGQAIVASGADSVLLATPGRVSSEIVVTPGAVVGAPIGIGPPGFYGVYRGVWAPTFIPPTAFTVKTLDAEARLFDAGTRTLQWSGTTRTELSGSDIDVLATQYATLIVDALARAGVIR